jgi:hypothetical protein
MEKDFGYFKGDICNRDGCNGVIEEEKKGTCTCHINPPCSACTEARAFCPECGWSADEEMIEKGKNRPELEPKSTKKIDNKIEWECLQGGQSKPYKDSIYIYRIKSNLPKKIIEDFCTNFLRPCSKKGSGFNGSQGYNQNYGHGLDCYYHFQKENESTEDIYIYKVCEPFCG